MRFFFFLNVVFRITGYQDFEMLPMHDDKLALSTVKQEITLETCIRVGSKPSF